MKKNNKWICRVMAVVMLIAFACTLSGCGKGGISGIYAEDPYNIKGGYKFESDGTVMKYDTNWGTPREITLEYTYGEYTVDDKDIVIYVSGEEAVSGTIVSDNLIVIDGMGYKKQTEPYTGESAEWDELNEKLGL